MEKTSGRLVATTILVAYGTVHLYGGVDVPTKPLTLAIQATMTGTSNNAVYFVPDMMSTKVDKSFSVTPPVDVRRPGRPTDRA
jgi:hypothetical protein